MIADRKHGGCIERVVLVNRLEGIARSPFALHDWRLQDRAWVPEKGWQMVWYCTRCRDIEELS